jgi:hypothetical protein
MSLIFCDSVKQGVLDGVWKADALVTLQEHTPGLEYLQKLRNKPFHKAPKIVLASLYSGSGMAHAVLHLRGDSYSCREKTQNQACHGDEG